MKLNSSIFQFVVSQSNIYPHPQYPVAVAKIGRRFLVLAFCKTQDDKTLQMAKLSFEQVQGILLLTALSDLRTSGKSLDTTKAQESCILESYKSLAALWVQDGSDFQYRCIYPKIVGQLKDSCLNEGKSLLAKAKRIKKELTKVYA